MTVAGVLSEKVSGKKEYPGISKVKLMQNDRELCGEKNNCVNITKINFTVSGIENKPYRSRIFENNKKGIITGRVKGTGERPVDGPTFGQ
jgi:hypothetical protein